jgi:hypothetical protein
MKLCWFVTHWPICEIVTTLCEYITMKIPKNYLVSNGSVIHQKIIEFKRIRIDCFWVWQPIVCYPKKHKGWFMVFKAIFNNISIILWLSVLLMEETTDLSQVTDKFIT